MFMSQVYVDRVHVSSIHNYPVSMYRVHGSAIHNYPLSIDILLTVLLFTPNQFQLIEFTVLLFTTIQYQLVMFTVLQFITIQLPCSLSYSRFLYSQPSSFMNTLCDLSKKTLNEYSIFLVFIFDELAKLVCFSSIIINTLLLWICGVNKTH